MTGASYERHRRVCVEEHVIFVVRRHWVVPVGEFVAATPLMLAGLEAILHLAPASGDVLRLPGAAVVAGLWVAVVTVRWSWIALTVTDRRVVATDGLLRRRRTEVAFDDIKTIAFRPSQVGRALGYGTFCIGTAADPVAVRFRQLPLDDLRDRLVANAAAHRLRRGRVRELSRDRCLT